jgi:GT2 family glycosyltransferase
MIKISICLSDIDKSRITVSNKNGKKYMNFLIKDSTNDKYGNDYMVTEDLSKEERQAGKQGKILGNGKNLGGGGGVPRQSEQSAPPSSNDSMENMPF